MKKWSRGKGTMLTPSLRRSEFSWPGNRSVVEDPDMTLAINELSSAYVGDVLRRIRKEMSYSASLSIQNVRSEFSTSWCYTDGLAAITFKIWLGGTYEGKSGIVWFDNSVRDLGRGQDRPLRESQRNVAFCFNVEVLTVASMRSGNSSRSFERSNVPRPEPVPPGHKTMSL
jgi:hypothetical protein